MAKDNEAPQAPRIPAIGEKLGQLDGWEPSEDAREGCSADDYDKDHGEDCDCPYCS